MLYLLSELSKMQGLLLVQMVYRNLILFELVKLQQHPIVVVFDQLSFDELSY